MLRNKLGESSTLVTAIFIVLGVVVMIIFIAKGAEYWAITQKSRQAEATSNFNALAEEVGILLGKPVDSASSKMALSLKDKVMIIGFSHLDPGGNIFVQTERVKSDGKFYRPSLCEGSCLCLYYDPLENEGTIDKKDHKILCRSYGNSVYFLTNERRNDWRRGTEIINVKGKTYANLAFLGLTFGTKALTIEKFVESGKKYIYIDEVR